MSDFTYKEVITIACKGLRGSVPTHYTAEGVVNALIEEGVFKVKPENEEEPPVSYMYGIAIPIKESQQ